MTAATVTAALEATELTRLQQENTTLQELNDSFRASLDVIDDRLADEGYGIEDRIRFARLHIQAVRDGHADPEAPAEFAVAEVTDAACLSAQVLGDEAAMRLGGGLYQDQAAATRAGMVTDQNNRRGQLSWQDLIREDYHNAFVPTDPAQVRQRLIQLAATTLLAVKAIDSNNIAAPTVGATR